MRTILKRYFAPGEEWEVVSEDDARQALEKFYASADPIMESLELGETIYTDVAMYQMVPEKAE